LQQYVEEKRVAVTDFAWSEGMPQWVFVSDVIGNLSQSTPRAPTFGTTTHSPVGELQTPIQASQSPDPLPGRFRFGRGLYFLSIIGLIFVMGAFSASKDTEALGSFVVIAGSTAVAVLRARDVGMSGWVVLLAFVPIANLFLYFRLFCTPRGYEITKKADNAMKAICWSLGGLIVLSIVIAILSSANH
jgi:uncharacterized membrane protein YhaH (DUF805 family)